MIKINKNEYLTGAMYAPFCRTLSVPMSEWEKDFENMKALGYNCAHGFAEWHDIEYEKGKFDFTRIDHMVDCAYRNGIVPIINVATQNSIGFYSPRWLMNEYEGDGYVDSNGTVIPKSQFAVPCLDDPFYQKYATRFLKAVACHFAGDERVGGYVLWGEPLLHRPGFSGADICYCEHTIAKFRVWLEEKYKDISVLNEIWSSEGPSDYKSFEEVMPPTAPSRQRGGFASWEDWKEFMEFNQAQHIVEADKIFKQNGALQPTITEMTTGINQSIDPWKLASGTDIIGVSCFGRPDRTTALYMSIASSMAKALDKSIFVVEAGGGSIKFMAPQSPSAQELKSTLLQRAGYGAKGLMYWCWRPRMSDTEGNDFGMVKPNGKPLQKTADVGKLAERLTELYDVYDNSVRKSKVAIYMSRQINHLMSSEGMSDNHCNSLVGANFIFSDLHINSDYICEKEILKGALDKYKVLILPCSYILSEQCAEKIEQFVKNGGTVMADYILAEKKPGGFCYYELPGAGLDKVFGIDRDDIRVIENTSEYEPNGLGIMCGGVMELVSLTGAKELYEYQGNTAICENKYGKGRAVYFTGQFFKSYAVNPMVKQRELLKELLSKSDVEPSLSLEKADTEVKSALITVTMSNELDKMSVITVTNITGEKVSDTLTLDDADYEFVEQNENFELEHKNGKCTVRFTLKAHESMALYLK